MRSLTIATAPASEPITAAEAKAQAKIETADDDTLVGTLITTARQMLEEWTGRAFITQTWDLWLDGWPAGTVIKVPRPPLQSVTSITYYDTSDAATVFSSSSYHVDTDAQPGRIMLNHGATWPTTSLRPAHAIRVRFVAGANAAAEIDKARLKLLFAHLYKNREPVVVGTIAAEIPLGLRRMMGKRFLTTLADD